MMIVSLLLSTLVIAGVYNSTPILEEIKNDDDTKAWVPTADDIAFQDSMYCIIERTQLDLDTIRAGIDRILYKLERIDYDDGSWDSIRYVKGSKFDIKRSKQ